MISPVESPDTQRSNRDITDQQRPRRRLPRHRIEILRPHTAQVDAQPDQEGTHGGIEQLRRRRQRGTRVETGVLPAVLLEELDNLLPDEVPLASRGGSSLSTSDPRPQLLVKGSVVLVRHGLAEPIFDVLGAGQRRQRSLDTGREEDGQTAQHQTGDECPLSGPMHLPDEWESDCCDGDLGDDGACDGQAVKVADEGVAKCDGVATGRENRPFNPVHGPERG